MRNFKRLLSIGFVFFLSLNLTAQVDIGGEPYSSILELGELRQSELVALPYVDVEALKAEDEQVDQVKNIPYRFGYNHDVDYNLENSGQWMELEGLGKIWRLGLKSEDALTINLTFSNYNLPEGASLFIYDREKTEVLGAYTSLNNQDHGRFATVFIPGDEVVLEYFEPYDVEYSGELELMWVTHAYRGPMDYYKAFGTSGACNVNVACPESAGWEDQINSVAMMVTGGNGFCTGTLINNTANDDIQYFLTADHCYSDPGTWSFYFNWQSATCTNPATSPDFDAVTGAELKARDANTDFCLVEINEAIPADYGVYYSGWNRTTDNALTDAVTGIHHPDGDIKKISWADGGVTASGYGGGGGTTHWEVGSWSDGTTTEPGSSGSGLWDVNKRLIGQLHGGSAACGNTLPDYYGRLGVSWTGGGTDATRLSNWLDPTGTEPETMDGRDPNAAADDLAADFEASQTNIMPGTSIDFTDLSTGSPTSHTWTFDGATPGTSNDPNPTGINYATNGTYDVTLEISDGTDNDTETKVGYIIVEDNPSELTAMFEPSETVISQGTCINFQDQSTGNPTSYTWTFDGGTPDTSTEQNPTNICFNTPGVYDVTLEIEDGTDTDSYTCSDCITVLDPGTDPICAFMANTTVIPVGGVVTFTDTSVNGPYVAWAWEFEGGIPATNEQETPPPVAYLNVGSYDVELRVEHENGNQYICTKEDYITVVPDAIEPPEANFIANYTVIAPGESVNFMDISGNAPYQWEWWFEEGFPETSTDQNPTNIFYADEGEYDVRLIARNSEGNDTIVKEDYIVVSEEDPCLENGDIPIAAYNATNRLLSAGQRTYFEDLSTNYPSTWNWYFDGGNPVTSTMGSPLGGIEYNVPGIYDVTLSVSNSCGVDLLTKDEYIYVFSGTVYQYCDTLTNVRGGEIPAKMNTPGTWGFIAGHNGERIRYYADKFNDYTFSQIEGLIVPVNNSVYGEYDSYVTFYVWEGSTEYPDSILAEKRMYIRNMPENFNSVVEFDSPVLVDGPFYVGYKLNYPDENGDGVSDDYFVVSVAGNRGPVESQNTMYVQKSSTWYSSVEYFNIATSLAIKPVACLVDISEFDIQKDVHTYPNPTSDMMTIELGDEYFGEEINIQVYDLTGRQISLDIQDLYSNEYQISFKDQTPGIYFIKIQIGEEMITKKISVIR
jgi:PKD repeat protein